MPASSPAKGTPMQKPKMAEPSPRTQKFFNDVLEAVGLIVNVLNKHEPALDEEVQLIACGVMVRQLESLLRLDAEGGTRSQNRHRWRHYRKALMIFERGISHTMSAGIQRAVSKLSEMTPEEAQQVIALMRANKLDLPQG
jgi:hypothetical protein